MSQSNSEFHNLEQFIGALGEYAPEDDYELTDIEIADILWLTYKRKEFDNKSEITFDLPEREHNQDRGITETEITSDSPLHNLPTSDTNPSTPTKYSPSKAPVYSSSDSSSSDGDLSLGIPDAPSLREPLNLLKYLRLLMQKVPSGREAEIDEDATVNQIAETQNWIPVLQDELEPRFDLALVIDESPSMLIWGHIITELKDLLQNYGIFRELKIWGIKLDDTKTTLQLISRDGSNSRIANPKELVDLTRRRLILIVSDCVSNIWRKGIIFPTLNLWTNKQPVAIIQMLPNLMWRKSALNLGMLVNLSSSRSGVANKDLIASKLSPSPNATQIPIISLEPEHISGWTKMLVGKREASVAGYLLPPALNIEDYPLLQEQQHALENQDTDARLKRFRRTTSPLGRKLASLLAASPVIRLPIVRLIQATLLPDSAQIQIAEVFLGGLLKPKADFISQADTNPELVEYEFIDPVIRNIFLEDAPVSDSVEILHTVSRYIAEQMEISMEKFMGYLKSPNSHSQESQELQPFAEVAIKILKKLGEEYLILAEEIAEGRFAKQSISTKLKVPDRVADELKDNLPPSETTLEKSRIRSNIKKILIIVEANSHSNLELERDIRNLQAVIMRPQNSEEEKDFEIRIHLSTRSTDLQKIILGYQPNIIHFCGHGVQNQGLVFRDKKISSKSLSGLFELSQEYLECVVLNGCYSEVQANEIVKHIDYVIGMDYVISNDAAIAFATGFYQALGYKKNYKEAFQFGCNAIDLTKYSEPNLFQKSEQTQVAATYSNLPQLDYPEFIGREKILKELLKQITPSFRQYITVVQGIGGIGKTALVFEAVNLCLTAKQKSGKSYHGVKIPLFDAIIFTSAKKTYLTPTGILTRPIFEETLQEIFRTIADVLQQPRISMAQDISAQYKLAYQYLGNQNTLLIIDGMESISNIEQEKLLSFLVNLPQSTQAIITSRNRLGAYSLIPISELSKEESLTLIKQEAKSKAVKVTDYQAERLYSTFGGMPIALIYAVGQRAIGYSLKRILGLLDNEKRPDDLDRFLFERSVQPLRGQAAHQLLMSITFFQFHPTRGALVTVAGLEEEPIDVEEGLAILQQLSLVSEENNRYSILPITHRYALRELAQQEDFLTAAQNRWVNWCISFTQQYGGKDWDAWRAKYDYLAQEWENIASVLHWCASRNRYEAIKQIWQSIDHYVDLSCYWRTRLYWWDWLIEKSQKRGDLPTYVMALSERAWTLILMGDKEAERGLNKAWEMRENVNLNLQAHLANHVAVYKITQKKYDEASQWLEQHEQLVNQAELPEREMIRHQVCIIYYRAEIAYRKWEKSDDKNEYNLAQKLFKEAYEKAQEIRWQRFNNYAQNWLADLAIIDGDFEKAERLLKSGFFVAQSSKERRRVGHFYASYARLEEKKGNKDKAREYAQKALSIFTREDIREDAEEMRELLM